MQSNVQVPNDEQGHCEMLAVVCFVGAQDQASFACIVMW